MEIILRQTLKLLLKSLKGKIILNSFSISLEKSSLPKFHSLLHGLKYTINLIPNFWAIIYQRPQQKSFAP